MSPGAAHVLLEVCVDSLESALAAQAGGADRVELCAGLLEGGLTPSAGTIELARRKLAIGLQVMIRPRGGDFCYSDLELEAMQRDIAVAKSLGADGVVLGVLRPDAMVDAPRTAALIAAARPLSVTFHRAFDLTVDPAAALQALIALRVDRVLTSGQAASAPQGSATLAALVRQAAGRIVVMAGGGLSEQSVRALVEQTGVREVHLSARVPLESAMTYRRPDVALGGAPASQEYQRLVASQERIAACRIALAGIRPTPRRSA
jgi:copper homeostasis protein